MPVNLEPVQQLPPVAGVRLGTARAGIRYADRDDLLLIECAPGTRAAAVFTRNRFVAAPVEVARDHLAAGPPRALLVNAGNANAGTGTAGREDALACCRGVAARLGCEPRAVWPFSTGVIGERLPVARVEAALPACVEALAEDGWVAAARAIMTTDTVPKGASRQVVIQGRPVTLTGIVKGAGMIHPDMATLLAFVATDAAVEGAVLQGLLEEAVAGSFHRITVDGDTSTNDACVLLATGRAGHPEIGASGDPACAALASTLRDLMTELAQAVVRDAEGATRFITVEVTGGAGEAECLAVARTVALSPLVKTACFAGDPNWGRILAAAGRAPAAGLDIQRVSLWLDDVAVVAGGEPVPAYRDEDGRRVMARAEFTLRVDLGRGDARAVIWTSDLSHDYVRINAEYRS